MQRILIAFAITIFGSAQPASGQANDACETLLTATPDEAHDMSDLTENCVANLPGMSVSAQSNFVMRYLQGARVFIPEERMEALAGRLTKSNALRIRALHARIQAEAKADGAAETVDKLVKQASSAGDQLSLAYLYLAQSELAKAARDSGRSETRLRAALSIARANKMSGLEAQLLFALGQRANNDDEYELGRKLSQSAVEKFTALGNLRGATRSCMNIGAAMDRDPGMTLDKAVKLLVEAGDNAILQICYNRAAGIIAFDAGDNEAVEKYINEALRLAKTNKFITMRPIMLNRFALGAFGRGEYDVAVSRYEEALKLYEADGEFGRAGVIYVNIAIIFFELGDNERAIELFQQAIDIYETLPNKEFFLPTALGNMGQAHATEGRHDVAVSLYKRAIAINTIQPNKELEGALNFQYAKSLHEIGQQQRALDLAILAVQQIGEHRAAPETATPLVWIAERYLERDDLAAAETALEQARVIMDPNNEGPEKMKAESININWYSEYARSMTKLLNALGRPQEALRFAQVALELGDDRFEADKLKAVANADILLKLRERDRDMQTLQQEALVKDLSLSQARLRAFLGIAGAALAGLLALLLLRSNRAQKRLVQTKDVFLNEIHHRTKNNLQLLISLLNLDARQQKTAGNISAGREDAANRARTMALVHDHIYDVARSTELNVKNFLDDLLELLRESLGGEGIELRADIDSAEIDMDKFTILGLLVCELVTNAYKHAFGNQTDNDAAVGGTIRVALAAGSDDLTLVVSDDGRGFDQDTGSNREGSMGMMLIEDLADQLGGKPHVSSSDGGTVWTISGIGLKLSEKKQTVGS